MAAFKIYRIVNTLTDKALCSGSDAAVWYGGRHPSGRPLAWHHRGSWSPSGAFFKTENTIRRHLLNLCYDWDRASNQERYHAKLDTHFRSWVVRKPGGPDYSRLKYLRVEQIYVSNHQTTTLLASDFMGVPDTAPVRPPENVQ